MDSEELWRLFWKTGLPEAYALRGRMRKEPPVKKKTGTSV